jgi:hypothetical protein
MSDYRRTTRECSVAQLNPDLARAIRDYARQQQWNNPEAEVVMCCETTSEKISTNRLDALLNSDVDEITHLALIITPQRLIWARSGQRAGVSAASARLKDVRLKIFTPKHTQDVSVDVYGRMEGTRKRVGGRLTLGPDPAAQKFCTEVMRAIDDLTPLSTEKPRRKWFGR